MKNVTVVTSKNYVCYSLGGNITSIKADIVMDSSSSVFAKLVTPSRCVCHGD